jgi:hypothetical protein
MAIVYRSEKGSALTSDEVDNNFQELEDTFASYLPLGGGTLSGGVAFSANNTGITWSSGGTTMKGILGRLTFVSAGGFSFDGDIYSFETFHFEGTTKGISWSAGHTIVDNGAGDLTITTTGDMLFTADSYTFNNPIALSNLSTSTLISLNGSKEIVSLANSAGLVLNNGSGTLSYTTFTGDGTVSSAGVFTGANTIKPTRALVAGSNVTNATTTLADITGLSVALAINSVYEFEAHLVLGTSADTDGTGYAVQYSAAGATVEAGFIGSANGVAGAKTVRINAFNTSTVACLVTNAQTGVATIKGIVRTGANAGDLTIQHKKFVAGTSTVYIDSFLKVTKL